MRANLFVVICQNSTINLLMKLSQLFMLMLTLANSVLSLSSLFPNSKPNVINYSGFKIENQVSLSQFPKNEYHLLYYIDNKLIWDKPLGNSSIPWAQTLSLTHLPHKLTSQNSLVLARRKTFALRKYPIYLPNTVVGGIFDGKTNTTLSPLVADDLLANYWISMSRSGGVTLHLPLLSTPNSDSTRFNFLQQSNDWDKYLKMDEDYKYVYDSRYTARKSLDFFINNLNSLKVVKTFHKLNTKFTGDFVLLKLFLLGKHSASQFNKMVTQYDELMNYE